VRHCGMLRGAAGTHGRNVRCVCGVGGVSGDLDRNVGLDERWGATHVSKSGSVGEGLL
jgi:hypothetical protein